ncbi:MAG TPA: Uma2 family endonuclease [Burkholderiales bacterium]|nr:Uma2 family endonuclease [Burkholderiales bacterium]
MALVEKLRPITVEEYLEGEKGSDVRHEYVAGAIYAMAGASGLHNLLTLAFAAGLRQHLRGSPCRVFMSDMKVRVNDAFYYPDLVVVCGAIDAGAYYQSAPVLLVEILSESTEARDRLEKRLAYQKIESLKEYVLVAQDKMRVEVYRRVEDGWQIETYSYGDRVRFASINYEVAIEQLYEDVLDYTSKK